MAEPGGLGPPDSLAACPARRLELFRRKWFSRAQEPNGADEPRGREESLREEVFPDELEYLRNRWQTLETKAPGLAQKAPPSGKDKVEKAPPSSKDKAEKDPPSTRNNLVGMALSGGGIRSTSFNLGILQSLHRRGVFKHIDYLSTVSGGGFLGSSLSALMREPPRKAAAGEEGEGPSGAASGFPFAQEKGAVEGPEVQYLRNNSNYLATRGLLDYLRIAAVLVRGILLNFLVLVPFLLLSAMVVILIYGQDLLTRLEADDDERKIAIQLELGGWVGTEGDGAVASLLRTLGQESLIATHRGSQEPSVIHALRGFGAAQRVPLITGQGDAESLEFRAGVTDRQVVRRLRLSGALVELEANEEIERIEQMVDKDGEFAQGLGDREVAALIEALEAVRAEEPSRSLRDLAEGDLKELGDRVLGRGPGEERSVPLLRPEADVLRVLETAWPPSTTSLISSQSEGAAAVEPSFESGTTLRQAIYRLYTRAQFDPRWIEEEHQRFWHFEPPAYWEFVELGFVRAELAALLDPTNPVEWVASPCGVEMLACPEKPQPKTVAGSSASAVSPSPSGAAGPGPQANSAWQRRSEELEQRLAPLEGVGADDTERVLDEVARDLYYGAQIERGWLARQRGEPSDDTGSLGLGQLPQVGEIHLAYDRFLHRPPREPWDPHRFRLPWTGRLAAFGLVWVMVYPLLLWLGRLARARWGRWTKRLLSCGLLFGGGLFLLATWFTLWVADLVPRARDLLVGLVLLAALFAGLVYLRRRRSALWWRDRLERSFSGILVAIAVAAVIELQPYIIYHYRSFEAGGFSWSIALGAASLLVSMAAGPLLSVLKSTGRMVVLALVALVGPLLPVLVYIYVVNFSLYAAPLFWSRSYVLDDASVVFIFLFLVAVVHVVNLPLDINSTSLHGFYRDRLSRAFLIGHDRKGEVRPADDLGLEEICREGTGAPYHLINVALNLQGSDDPTVRRRKSDFFTFSRHHIGGPLTGYCPTSSMRRVFPNLFVSSATAISAAAAAPNMGTFTFAPLVILMALLNVRLGFWLPNPARARVWGDASGGWLKRGGKWLRRVVMGLAGAFHARPGAYFLLSEMLSRMDHEGNFVNLSDGGHIENTGAYELLRRRCRFIIVGDAEADPEMRFTGLANLLRYARIDLGIEVELAVDDLGLDEDGRSRQHAAFGVIRYPAEDKLPREDGYLLYLKSSVTGDEDEVISEYRKRSKGFPHESTADQSFTEGQFEAYRGLGEHVAEGLFGDGEPLGAFGDFRRWFLELRTSLSPGRATGTPAPETEAELAAISRELRRPELVGYFYEIHPGLEPEGFRADQAADPEGREFLAAFQLAGRQLQLMQSLFVQLELDRRGHRDHPGNRGWMNLFQSWARSATFQRAYLRLITSGSGAFQEFCETALGLELDFRWTSMQKSKLRAALKGEGRTEKGRQPIVGRLELRLKKRPGAPRLKDRIHIGYLRLLETGAEVDLLPGYKGTGLISRARIELGRWATENGLPVERLGVGGPSIGDVGGAE